MRSRDSTISSLKAANDGLRAEHQEAGAVFRHRERSLENQVESVNAKLGEVEAVRIRLEGEVASLTDAVKEGEAEAKELHKKLEASAVREGRLQERAEAAEREHKRTETQLEERRAAAAALQVRLEEMADKLAAETARAGRLQDEIDLIYRPIEVKERKTSQKLVVCEGKLAMALKSATTLNTLLNQEKAHKAEALNKLEVSERGLAAVTAARQAVQSEAATLRQANKQQSGIMKQLQTAVQQLKQRVIQLQQKEQKQMAATAATIAAVQQRRG